jgi:multimeric flavodoxin WrbA
MLVTIIYDSGYGHTEKQAEAVAEGVRCVPGVDKHNSLIAMVLFAAQHGMIWVGLDLFPGKTAEEPQPYRRLAGAMAQSDDVPAVNHPLQATWRRRHIWVSAWLKPYADYHPLDSFYTTTTTRRFTHEVSLP